MGSIVSKQIFKIKLHGSVIIYALIGQWIPFEEDTRVFCSWEVTTEAWGRLNGL